MEQEVCTPACAKTGMHCTPAGAKTGVHCTPACAKTGVRSDLADAEAELHQDGLGFAKPGQSQMHKHPQKGVQSQSVRNRPIEQEACTPAGAKTGVHCTPAGAKTGVHCTPACAKTGPERATI
jgi:hypothetical protein